MVNDTNIPTAMAVNGKYIYFVSGLSLWRAPLSTGVVEQPPIQTGGTMTSLAMSPDGATLYWTAGSGTPSPGVYKAVADGAPPTPQKVYTPQTDEAVDDVGAIGARLVWLSAVQGTWSVSAWPGGASLLEAGSSKPKFAVGGAHAYWHDGNNLWRVDDTATTATLVFSSLAVGLPGTFAVDEDPNGYYYWTNGSFLKRGSKVSQASIPIDSGAITGVAATKTDIYWIDMGSTCASPTGYLYRLDAPLSGTKVKMASGLTCPLVLMQDANYVYVAHGAAASTSIIRIHK